LARNAHGNCTQAVEPGDIQRRDQCKIALVASPRYQRYLVRPGNVVFDRVSGPCSFLARDAQDACEIAVEIDAKVFSPLFGREHDLVDQRPQMRRGFAAPVLTVQSVPEILDFATVALRPSGSPKDMDLPGLHLHQV
jgi:hypothetical protein